ncbi:MAG: hypothetical protein M3Z37_04520 [Candidatus Eremiobacteraeota bacterium]|nr:hypothetical protein [Candidatus Eremiobacteraeota bacterium]
MTAITNVQAPPGVTLPDGGRHLAALLERGLGLSANAHNIAAFIDQCGHRAKGLGIPEDAYYEMLAGDGPSARTEWMAIAPALTVGETFLFRDAALWRLIETTLLPNIASLARPLWLWSAGCSTGEETYTLAIVARRALAEHGFSILGTDVNPKAVAAARVGVYTPWSLRGLQNIEHDGLIVSGTQTVRVHDEVKNNVRFEVHNLNDPSAYPPAGMSCFECILCRNVLIYMTASAKAAVIASLASCLAPGGVLILGHGEAAGIELGGLVVERHDAGVVYRKQCAQLVPASRPLAQAPKNAARKHARPAGKSAQPGRAARGAAPRQAGPVSRIDATVAGARSLEPDRVASTPSAHQKMLASEMLTKALRHARAGENAVAERHAHHAIALDPLNPDAYVLIAALSAARDAFKDAEATLRRALFLDPAHIPALWQLGALYRLTNKQRQATYTFARLLARLEGLPPDKEALPFDGLTVDELTALLRAALGEATHV